MKLVRIVGAIIFHMRENRLPKIQLAGSSKSESFFYALALDLNLGESI